MKLKRLTTSSMVLFAILSLSFQSANGQQAETISNSIDMELALIPAGTFIMGSPRSENDRNSKEERHEVTISSSFYMGVFEVTQQQYMYVMEEIDDPQPNVANRSRFKGDDRPIENVEWRLAKIFCERLSSLASEREAGRTYRLPTEAEWEYACRAGTTTPYHFGDAISSESANFNGNYPGGDAAEGPYRRQTAEVGAYEPNAFGLYDMHGNVSEWCSDWYDPNYYLDSPEIDPAGPPFGVIETDFNNNGRDNYFVVVRGGSWVDDARACRSAYRYRAMPNTQYQIIGFRVVCEVASTNE